MSHNLPLLNALEEKISLLTATLQPYQPELRHDMPFIQEQLREMTVLVNSLKDLDDIAALKQRKYYVSN